MKKVNSAVPNHYPRPLLVKIVGNIMKKQKFVKRKVNNVIYFSLN